MVKSTINDTKAVIFAELQEFDTKCEGLIASLTEKTTEAETKGVELEKALGLLGSADATIEQLKAAAGNVAKSNDISVVICYNRNKQTPEALLATIRSIEENLATEYDLFVIGDHEEWFGDKIGYIAHEAKTSNAGLDIIHKIQVACESEQVSDKFIVAPVGTYFISPVLVGDIESLKLYKPFFMLTAEKQALENSNQLLKEKGYAVNDLTYACQLPVVYEKEKFARLFVEYPDIDTMIVSIEQIYFKEYFNLFSATLLDYKTDNVKLNVLNENPSPEDFNTYIAGKKFLVPFTVGDLVRKYLSDRFGKKCSFEK